MVNTEMDFVTSKSPSSVCLETKKVQNQILGNMVGQNGIISKCDWWSKG